MAELFLGLVGFVIVGWLWFFVARPIVTAWLPVSSVSPDPNPEIMSNSQNEEPATSGLSLRQTVPQTDRPDDRPLPSRAEMLDICSRLRRLGASREEARSILRLARLPLDNNMWAEVSPPETDNDDVLITPIAGRRTKASYYPDEPALEYQAPTT